MKANTAAQTAQILNWLKKGKSLTPLQALQKFDCFRLGARIWDLRHAGHNIITEPHTTPTGKIVAKYSLK